MSSHAGPVVGLMLPVVAATDDGRLDAGRLLEAARLAERAGFDGVYVGDHLLHPRPILEAVASLAAVAAVTERVNLGTCVMLAALRDPLWLAKQLGTISAFAPGRLRLGVGAGGEYPAEFAAAGIPLPERGRRLAEVVQQLRALFAGEAVWPEAGGPGVRIAPLPDGPVPVLFAGWKEAALARAAALGDGWIGYLLSPESFARRRAFVLERRAAPFTTGMLLPVHLDAKADGARERAAQAWGRITDNGAAFPERLFVAGPPEALVEQLRAYWDLGCEEMVLSLVDQGSGYLDQLDVLAEAVLPRLKAFGLKR
jgi:alkanesulfonate monooxygenase SsuD/methylene tetrahydromethanopterin reductase-like flavin-dependent oxidoreductase (luciferase family)